MTIVITKGDNPGNYIYVDVNADFATRGSRKTIYYFVKLLLLDIALFE
jgi:hypothetical protein